MKLKEWVYRALISEQSKVKTALIGIGVSAVAAGLAAVMNINNDKESDSNADD